MISYRFKRRAFLSAMGGGLGLKIMLRNLEASAQGMKSPPRLLVTHWPIGIVAGKNDAMWTPTTGSVGGSQALKPFADAGLAADMTVLRGISTTHLNVPQGGGHEQGMVEIVTGRMPSGQRANCCEGDDVFAAPGGSYDQILMRDVPALQRPAGSANSIADSRTDFAEVSAKTMSYSTTSRTASTYTGGTGMEATPLSPVLSPLTQYQVLFGTFMPGSTGTGGAGGAGGSGARPVADATMRRLVRKKSVLDFAIEELNQMRTLAPASARPRLEVHSQAVQAAEDSVVQALKAYPSSTGAGGAGGGSGTGGAGGAAGPTCGTGAVCPAAPAAPPMTNGIADPTQGDGIHYGNGADVAKIDDGPTHLAAGRAHLDVLKAAFVCDLIRVGTFQWAPSTTHVGFKLFPGDTTNAYMHNPTSHRIGTSDTLQGTTPDTLQPVAHFLYNVQLWYFSRMAEHMAAWKTTVDGCGNSLLDNTVVPFLTEVAAVGHERNNMPGMIFGGKKLGFNHNLYKTGAMPINDVWATVGQAFGHPGGDVFGTPIGGLWTKPA